jgi:predicted nucleic acid-binding protein
MLYLLDTNALSEGRKRRPDPGLASWLLQHEAASAVSELTIGEFTKGAHLVPAPAMRNALLNWIAEVEDDFHGRCLPVTLEILKRWGRLCGEHEARGRKLPVMDSILAATALVHDLTLVTRNTADFPAEVRTLNPWRR